MPKCQLNCNAVDDRCGRASSAARAALLVSSHCCAAVPLPLPLCRLSTVQTADQIVVMKAGRIAEKGTHNELLERQGAYSELMSSQEMILGASV